MQGDSTPSKRRPPFSIRILIITVVWALVGYAMSHFYVTDACPPEVKAKEARLYGLLAPLSCAGEASTYISNPSMRPIVGWGFLLTFVALGIAILRSKSWTPLVWSSGALVLWFDLGLYFAIYQMTHPPA